MNFPESSVSKRIRLEKEKKEPACNSGDPGLILGAGRSHEEGIGYPLQFS